MGFNQISLGKICRLFGPLITRMKGLKVDIIQLLTSYEVNIGSCELNCKGGCFPPGQTKAKGKPSYEGSNHFIISKLL